MAPCACVLRSLLYHQALCVGRLSRPWYEKVGNIVSMPGHQYANERRVCPNIDLHSNRLAVVNFFVEDGRKIYLAATLTYTGLGGNRTIIIFVRSHKHSLTLYTQDPLSCCCAGYYYYQGLIEPLHSKRACNYQYPNVDGEVLSVTINRYPYNHVYFT